MQKQLLLPTAAGGPTTPTAPCSSLSHPHASPRLPQPPHTWRCWHQLKALLIPPLSPFLSSLSHPHSLPAPGAPPHLRGGVRCGLGRGLDRLPAAAVGVLAGERSGSAGGWAWGMVGCTGGLGEAFLFLCLRFAPRFAFLIRTCSIPSPLLAWSPCGALQVPQLSGPASPLPATALFDGLVHVRFTFDRSALARLHATLGAAAEQQLRDDACWLPPGEPDAPAPAPALPRGQCRSRSDAAWGRFNPERTRWRRARRRCTSGGARG